MWVLLLAGFFTGFSAFEIQTIHGQLGSDLQVPVLELCNSTQDVIFDVYSGEKHIGSHHRTFQGINGFQDRLYFNPENCTITLKNLSEASRGNFKITVWSVVNDVPVKHDVEFSIDVTEQTPLVNKTQHNAPFMAKLYVSAGLSLIPSLLAGTIAIFWVLIRFGKLHDHLNTISKHLRSFWIFTIICQIISLCCWSCHEWLVPLFPAILITGILLVDVAFCIWRGYKHQFLSVPIAAPTPDSQFEVLSPEEPGSKVHVSFCGCWPRCGQSSSFYYTAPSPAVNPQDSGAQAEELWMKRWKISIQCWLWILLFTQLLFTMLVWIAYSTIGEISHTLYYCILPVVFGIFSVTGILILYGSKRNAVRAQLVPSPPTAKPTQDMNEI